MQLQLKSDDRLLWILVGGGLLVAANVIPYYLYHLRTLTQVAPDDESAGKGPCESAEDRLKLSTLEKLAHGTSYKLRSSAIKIVAERSTQGAARSQLLRDLASTEPAKREQALQALWFLLSHPSLKDSDGIMRLFSGDVSAFAAITECLTNLLPLHEDCGGQGRADNPTAASPLLPHRRPPSESLALRILLHLLTDLTVVRALDAGLISRWLQYYPFPCALAENGGRRQDVVKYFDSWGHDDPIMASIMGILTHNREGSRQLRKHGLTDPSYGSRYVDRGLVLFPPTTDDEYASRMQRTRASMSAAVPDFTMSQPRDTASASAQQQAEAERAARQRRREAAVYSEGNAPLTQDNIFQRQSSSSRIALPLLSPPSDSDLEVEAELARLTDDMERERQQYMRQHRHQRQHQEGEDQGEDQDEDRDLSSPDEVIRPGISSNFWQSLTMNSTLSQL